MAARWHFVQQQPAQPIREATQGEFFATEAIPNPAAALVREGGQNSLDAACNDANPVRVRILLATGRDAVTPSAVAPFFEGSWDHLHAPGNGLRTPPKQDEPCSFLVFEDFGTSGLVGDVEQWTPDADSKNAFFYFFRAEGRTGKSEQDRGRWGIGKYVFPRSSRINAVFGLTVRRDDGKRLLMGKAVLKSHSVSGTAFTPDGGYGSLHENGMVLPVDDSARLDAFAATFHLKRRDETGLSLVVPYVDIEFTPEMIVEAMVRDYFYPILAGSLVAEIATPDANATVIDDSTISDVINALPSATTAELKPVLALAAWSCEQKADSFIKLNPAPSKPEWTRDLIPDDVALAIREKLSGGECVAIRVPLTVRPKEGIARESYFDVFLVEDSSGGGKPIFIREGVIISDNKRVTTLRGVRALVVVEDKPLATLLGDSENPAHTQWQRDSSNFKDKYFNGLSYLGFVVRSAERILARINELERKEDTNLLRDIFSIPPPEQEQPVKTKKKETKPKPGDEEELEKPNVETKPRRFQIEKTDGGFSIFRGSPDSQPPALLEIRVAYDVRRGTPLKRYKPADFRLDRAPIHVTAVSEITVRECAENRLLVEPTGPEFRLEVSGFDLERDVFVEAKPKEKQDDPAT